MNRILTNLKKASAAPITSARTFTLAALASARTLALAALARLRKIGTVFAARILAVLAASSASVRTWAQLAPEIASVLVQIAAGCAVLYAWYLLAMYFLAK